ncbi:MAG: Mur ligase domain-containing protein, partial [Silvibacterium sp.]
MRVDEVLRQVECVRRAGGSAEVTGVEYDSRRVAPGCLFLAMRGESTDGNRYIARAVEAGAVAVITDSAQAFDETALRFPQISLAEVRHGRRALAVAAAKFFSHPEHLLALSGV